MESDIEKVSRFRVSLVNVIINKSEKVRCYPFTLLLDSRRKVTFLIAKFRMLFEVLSTLKICEELNRF